MGLKFSPCTRTLALQWLEEGMSTLHATCWDGCGGVNMRMALVLPDVPGRWCGA